MRIHEHFSGIRTQLGLALSYLPQRRADDAFIIAHPRSGSTWLRTILVNTLEPDANSNPDVFNKLIPAASLKNIRAVQELPSPRILMSHSSYLPGLPKVIYLVRDGRDALVSYYHYINHRKSKLSNSQRLAAEIDFPKFFSWYYQGRYRHIWHQHVESWLTSGKMALGERMMVVRFEEMKADPHKYVDQIVQFAGIPADSDCISNAIRLAGLKNVREVEKQRWQAKGLGTPDQTTSFYRSGKSKNWEEIFTPELAARFLEHSSKAMELAGYQK